MSKTTLIGVFSGLASAAVTYGFMSKDTTRDKDDLRVLEGDVSNKSFRIPSDSWKKYEPAINNCRKYVKRYKDEIGAPGVVIGVSVDGKIIWEEGFGYANLETSTPCHADTVMRIASISKPITMALLAKLYESQKISLDKSVHDYVPYFPRKSIEGKEVDITIRQLASHTAGVRHYKKKGEEVEDLKAEFYLKKKFENVEESVNLFKNDELLFAPGTSFEYTTHGYTLLSAVIESVGKKPFSEQIQTVFTSLGLNNTHLDRVERIIYERASYYHKNKQGRIINAELADTSYKWAGGGLVSTVGDLLKFANAMLYSYQQTSNHKAGFLKKETVQEMWTPVKNTVMKWGQNAGYGLGWTVVPEINEIGGLIEHQKFFVGHSGGAVGASSVLMIFPKEIKTTLDENQNVVNSKLPSGLAIAVLVNLENVSCVALGKKVAAEFSQYE